MGSRAQLPTHMTRKLSKSQRKWNYSVFYKFSLVYNKFPDTERWFSVVRGVVTQLCSGTTVKIFEDENGGSVF